MVGNYIVRGLAALVIGLLCSFGTIAEEQHTFDALLSEVRKNLSIAPKEADSALEKLKALQPTFTPEQNEKYQIAYAHSLGDKGRHA